MSSDAAAIRLPLSRKGKWKWLQPYVEEEGVPREGRKYNGFEVGEGKFASFNCRVMLIEVSRWRTDGPCEGALYDGRRVFAIDAAAERGGSGVKGEAEEEFCGRRSSRWAKGLDVA